MGIVNPNVRCTPFLREHSFNLRGGGAMVFFGGKQFLSTNLIEKQFLSLKWAEKNSVSTLLNGCSLTEQKYTCKTRKALSECKPPSI